MEQQRAVQRAWEAERLGRQRYTARVAGVEPLVECQAFFYVVIHERRLWRRYLRQCFRFEVRRGVWLPRKRPPTNGEEAAYFTQVVHLYDFWTRIFLAGLDAIDMTRRDTAGLFTPAAATMRNALGGLADVFARGLDSTYAFERQGAELSMAGCLKRDIRLFPSLRQALSGYGNPRTVLQELLPLYIRLESGEF
jgi:hypothetical protein